MERPDTNPKSAVGVTKPPLHLVPSSALMRVAMVMKLGAEKYGAYNWRDQSVAATVYVSAAERHLRAWLDGEHLDPESGQPHLAHMVACGLILLDAQDIGKMVDDRPPAGAAGRLVRELTEKKEPERVHQYVHLSVDSSTIMERIRETLREDGPLALALRHARTAVPPTHSDHPKVG